MMWACRISVAGALLAGTWVPGVGTALDAPDSAALDSAFRTCVFLYDHPLAGALMRTIGNRAARDGFAAAHPQTVRSYSIERSGGYSTATATLNDGASVAGVAVRAMYASTCELECALAVWGLEFGPLKADQRKALQAWAGSAPSTHTGARGDIKVQLNTTTDGQTVLVCDVSGY